ncbi:dTDP-4-dehydrorhamnose reductase [Oceanihabitans sediminis]|uniref:dTDP-4-dehydrorhamnose reductase n=1 Tax=Oceanihabitans sediminis TaxID=1812012 RepID=UPI003A95A309
MKTQVLVTGANGQLGKTIKKMASKHEDVEFVLVSKDQLDITDENSINSFFEKYNFLYCVNCAAYTNVDQAEKNKNLAFQVNAYAVKNLAISCKKYGVVLIHISTDFVFEGTKNQPYSEEDITNPINTYGASKLEGENHIREALEKYFIIRTSWLYSEFGNNFVSTMLRLAEKNEEISVVNDQFGCPTNAFDLANVILEIISKKNSNFGLYHFSNTGKTSWYDFAKSIFQFNDIKIRVRAIPSDQYPTLAKRPRYSVLNTSKIERILNLEIKPWEEYFVKE